LLLPLLLHALSSSSATAVAIRVRPATTRSGQDSGPAGWRIQPLGEGPGAVPPGGAARLVEGAPPSPPPLGRAAPPPPSFAFDAVFDGSAPNSRVYGNFARPLVASVLGGRNATLLAYGAAGSGKTHAMQGSQRDDGDGENSRGVIQLAAADLFASIESDPERSYAVTAQYFEIRNEQIRDLLADGQQDETKGEGRQTAGGQSVSDSDKNGHGDEERESDNKDDIDEDRGADSPVPPSGRGRHLSPRKLFRHFVPSKARPPQPPAEPSAKPPLPPREAKGTETVPAVKVLDSDDVVRLLRRGTRNRAVAAIRGGDGHQDHAPSRSHAIFRITVESRPRNAMRDGGGGDGSSSSHDASRWVSTLNLVDLAGSENAGRSGKTGLRRREGGTIDQRYLRSFACFALRRCGSRSPSAPSARISFPASGPSPELSIC
jgi:hypothetical protein